MYFLLCAAVTLLMTRKWKVNVKLTESIFLLTASNQFGHQYITSLYWAAATSASVGYGDIHAHNTTEVSVTSIVGNPSVVMVLRHFLLTNQNVHLLLGGLTD